MRRFFGFSMVLGAAVAAGWFGAIPVNATGLPQTGQKKCWDSSDMEADCATADIPGQDGFYQAGFCDTGRVERYVDNGDGTVTDFCTGLMWCQNADTTGDGVEDAGDLLNWVDGLQYAEALTKAGHSDWRLPNLFELDSIFDHSTASPSYDAVFGQGAGGQTYSGSHLHTRDNIAVLNFAAGGYVRVAFGAGTFFIRAVRTVTAPLNDGTGDLNGDFGPDLSDAVTFLNWFFQSQGKLVPSICVLPKTGRTICYEGGVPDPAPQIDCADTGEASFGQDAYYQKGNGGPTRFIDNGDGTVTDTVTTLMWKQAHVDTSGDGAIGTDGSDAVNWDDALAACDALSFAGHDDWRCPNFREILSIAVVGAPGFGVSTIHPIFDDPGGVSIENFTWSSTTVAAAATNAHVWATFNNSTSTEAWNKHTPPIPGLAVRACRGGRTNN